MIVYEVIIPTLNSNANWLGLNHHVFTCDYNIASRFIKQHQLQVFEIKRHVVDDANDVSGDADELRQCKFKSNEDHKDYTLYTTETILTQAIDYVGQQLAEVTMFGDMMLKTKIEIVDIISALISKLPHAQVSDYSLLEDHEFIDEVRDKYKRYQKPYYDGPQEESYVDYIYESLHDAMMGYGQAVEPISLEGYVSYWAMILTDRI